MRKRLQIQLLPDRLAGDRPPGRAGRVGKWFATAVATFAATCALAGSAPGAETLPATPRPDDSLRGLSTLTGLR